MHMSEIELTDASFESEVINSDVPVLVDFWAPWCGPCKAQGPILEDIAKEYEGKGIKIGKLNIDDNEETPGKFGVMSIPTMILFKGSEEVARVTGLQSADKLKELIDSNL